jgi:hypothetical protein
VCPDSKHSVTPGAIRARRFREGATHKANLARKAEQRELRREKWLAARRKFQTITFDGRDSGPLNNVGPLSAFGKKDPELQGI